MSKSLTIEEVTKITVYCPDFMNHPKFSEIIVNPMFVKLAREDPRLVAFIVKFGLNFGYTADIFDSCKVVRHPASKKYRLKNMLGNNNLLGTDTTKIYDSTTQFYPGFLIVGEKNLKASYFVYGGQPYNNGKLKHMLVNNYTYIRISPVNKYPKA